MNIKLRFSWGLGLHERLRVTWNESALESGCWDVFVCVKSYNINIFEMWRWDLIIIIIRVHRNWLCVQRDNHLPFVAVMWTYGDQNVDHWICLWPLISVMFDSPLRFHFLTPIYISINRNEVNWLEFLFLFKGKLKSQFIKRKIVNTLW